MPTNRGGRVGGGGKLVIFELSADHTKIVKPDGVTEAATEADAAIIIGGDGEAYNEILETTDITANDDGTLTYKFAQTKYDSDYKAFAKKAFPRNASVSSSNPDEKYSETGKKIGGDSGSGSDKNYLILSYGSDNGDTNVEASAVIFKKTSGSIQKKKGGWITPNIEATSVAPKVDISIPAALFDADKVTVSTPQVLAKGDYQEIFFLTTKV